MRFTELSVTQIDGRLYYHATDTVNTINNVRDECLRLDCYIEK